MDLMRTLLKIFIVCAVSASGIAFVESQIAQLSPGQAAYISNFLFADGSKIPIIAHAQTGERDTFLIYSVLTVHRERKRIILFLKPERNKSGRFICRSQSLVDIATTTKP